MDWNANHHDFATLAAFNPTPTAHDAEQYFAQLDAKPPAVGDSFTPPLTPPDSRDYHSPDQSLIDQLVQDLKNWIAARKQSAYDQDFAIRLARDIFISRFGFSSSQWQAWAKVLAMDWQIKKKTRMYGKYSIRANAENINDLQKLQKNIDQMVSCRYRTVLSMPLIRDVIAAEEDYTRAAVAELHDRVRLDVNEHAHRMKLARDEEYAALIAGAGDDEERLRQVKLVWKKEDYVFVPKKAVKVDDKRRKRARSLAKVVDEQLMEASTPVKEEKRPRVKRQKRGGESSSVTAGATTPLPMLDTIECAFDESMTPAPVQLSSQTLSDVYGYIIPTPPPCTRCEVAACAGMLLERIQSGEGEYRQAILLAGAADAGLWYGQDLGLAAGGPVIDVQEYPIASFSRLGELKELLSSFAEHVRCKETIVTGETFETGFEKVE